MVRIAICQELLEVGGNVINFYVEVFLIMKLCTLENLGCCSKVRSKGVNKYVNQQLKGVVWPEIFIF